MPERRRGLLMGFTAYALWGAFPLYFPLLEPAGAVEILGHRIVWTMVTMLLLLFLARRAGRLRELLRDRRTTLLLAGAALVISFNWGVYIWGVNNERVVETSLGYFINPLVTVLLGVVVLSERLRPVQWSALALATLAVVVLTVDYGRPPWVALILAFSFGSYGLLKKTANTGAVESLTLETLVLAPVAVGYLVVLSLQGEQSFTGHGTDHMLLLASSGIVTAIPLLSFGGAATRIPMTTLGLMQYLTPTIQFCIGVLVRDEAMSGTRWLGFGLIWVALAIFTIESAVNHRRTLAEAAEAVAA
ncbi:MAG TPA: EamA family transporter RarD [Nocardioidaceae bacterium]|nr:EamA family transporter RarD [Nocardioidaceae bacterium]